MSNLLLLLPEFLVLEPKDVVGLMTSTSSSSSSSSLEKRCLCCLFLDPKLLPFPTRPKLVTVPLPMLSLLLPLPPVVPVVPAASSESRLFLN